MNAVGLLFDYIKVKFRPDWKIVLKPKQVCSELSISNSTFYRALKKVGQLLGKVIHLRQERAIPTSGTEIPTYENHSPTHETETSNDKERILAARVRSLFCFILIGISLRVRFYKVQIIALEELNLNL